MKYKQITLILLATTLFNIAISTAQKSIIPTKQQPLRVGDKVPDFTLINLINYPTKTAKLSDFKGKLVILDIWHTGCRSCIESWPKLQKLQAEFDGRLQIILLNPIEDEVTVMKLIEKRKSAGVVNLTLPSVCKDSTIKQLFPFIGLPHYVWIDGDGIVRSITDGISSEKALSLLDDNNISIAQKNNSPMIEVDFTQPLFHDGNGNSGVPILWRSILTGYGGRMHSTYGMQINKDGKSSIYTMNHAIREMYRYAYSKFYSAEGINMAMVPLSQTLIYASDKTKYEGWIKNEYHYQNLFVYQLTVGRSATCSELQKMMQEDLFRYFGLDVKWEKRKMECLVFTATDTSRCIYKGGISDLFMNDTDVRINGVSMAQIIRCMQNSTNYYNSPYPIIDETGYSERVGRIEFSTNVYNHVALDKAFSKFGIRLKLDDRYVDVLVIRESGLTLD